MRLCLPLAAALPLALQGAEVPAPPELAEARAAAEKAVAEGHTPSVAVAVLKDGRLVWAEGFGLADVERGTKATADSIYRLASISKPITASGLMLLRDRGLVDLDRPANDYLRGVKLRAHAGKAEAMTLRRLLNHTSGLPVHYNFYHAGAEPLSFDETIRRYGFAAWEPGTRWEYSNLAFGIAGSITEAVAGIPWRELLERDLLDPLGMTRTSDRVRPGHEAEATVQYSRKAGGGYLRVAPYRFDHDGGSVMWSSAGDLIRFARLHLEGGAVDGVRVLREETVRDMQLLTGERNAGAGTGIGWSLERHRGQRLVSHSGGMPGVATLLRLFPDAKLAYAILTNCDPGPAIDGVAGRLDAALLPAAEEREEERPPEPAGDPAAWTGVWRGRLAHFDGDLPLALEVLDPREARVRFGDGRRDQLDRLSLRSASLVGQSEARIRTQEGFHGVPVIEWRLRREGDRATGVAVALAQGYFALSHWVELARDAAAAPPEREPEGFDLLISGGRVVDGSGSPWYAADVAVRGGRIAAIGRLKDARAGRTIEARGLHVAPGFIDLMGQTGTPLLEDPAAGLNLLTQGITTLNAGEGGSAAPLDGKEAEKAGWRTMAEYFARLEAAGLAVNLVQTVGHTRVRKLVLGDADRRASVPEMERMKALVREAMEAGAIGLSTALIYPPAVYAPREEIAELAKVAGEHGGRYFTHMRNEGDLLLEAIDEALDIGTRAGTPVHIFHLKTAGEANWPKMDQALARIRAARAAGQEVGADIYPYINNGLDLDSFVHPRHAAAGQAELLRRLGDAAFQAAIRREMETEGGWENWYRHVGSTWENVVLGGLRGEPYGAHGGKSLAEIARAVGKDPWEVFFELAPRGVFAMPRSMCEANKLKAMREEFVSFCTDVGPAGGSQTASHPRAWGAFPRVLGRYVRELGALSLEGAVARMAGVAAGELGLRDRGRIAPGLAADIVVFDLAQVRDRATLAEPQLVSEGIIHVIVNGEVVLEGGKYTGARPGHVLRGPGYRGRR